MKKRGKTICTIAVMLVLYVLIAVGLVYMLYRGGNYPAGTNTLQYIYRAKMLLKGIGEGNGFPLYDPYWFNGEQLLRYVEPLPIYLMQRVRLLWAAMPIQDISFLWDCSILQARSAGSLSERRSDA